jgi:hypothetical protein
MGELTSFAEGSKASEMIKLKLGGGTASKTFAAAYEMTADEIQVVVFFIQRETTTEEVLGLKKIGANDGKDATKTK